MCGSRRDQEEGDELNSHEGLGNHVRVQARSRAGLSRTVGQSCAGQGKTKSWTLTNSWTIMWGPGEIKSWTLTNSWTIVCAVKARPRAGLSRTVGQSCAGQGKTKSWTLTNSWTIMWGPGEIKSWTLTKSWTVICGPRRDQEEGGELDSHEKLTIIYGSRRDQEEGSELNSHEEFDNHLRGPGKLSQVVYFRNPSGGK